SAYTHFNREDIIADAMELGCSHLQFVDWDVRFGESAIQRLIDRDVDIVGADYNRKELPLRGACEYFYPDQPTATFPTNEPFRVPALPTGFILINLKRVKEKMTRPYFETIQHVNRDERVGEDIYFTKKANATGLEVWCDPTVKVKHVGDY